MTKPYFFIILVIAILFGLQSCCTKKACSGDIRSINLVNFDSSKLDSITIEVFQKNSSVRTDSVFTHAYPGEDSNQNTLYLMQNIDPDMDYKITIISTDEVFIINGFETQQQGCNTCFPSHPANDYYTSLKSYTVNGQQQFGPTLTINK